MAGGILTRGLADTTVFIARESGRPLDESSLPDELAVSVITIGELRAGVLSARDVRIRDQRLTTLTAAMALDPVPIDDAVAGQWARLRVLLRDSGQRMPVNDSWIAATAMALAVPVVTQDVDYLELDDLPVIRV
ncbi:MAG: type II toxin-antitoxin system VapC family toxin [Acidimicrobiales bacterium]|nr:type II toxin-antitoxin system VapC family toxin [Acidimicrobiales bacterium]